MSQTMRREQLRLCVERPVSLLVPLQLPQTQANLFDSLNSAPEGAVEEGFKQVSAFFFVFFELT